MNRTTVTQSAVIPIALCFASGCSAGGPRPDSGSRVQTDGRWFVVDGERFVVRGIGYVPCGPRVIPWQRTFNPDLMAHDLPLMKAAGFNTVRSWNPYSPDELKILRKHDMMVIQGFWFDFRRYVADEQYAEQTRKRMTETAAFSRDFDNILFYTIMNEPHPD
ncbi:MAG: hypothetical protein ACYS9X_19100, partial [Planctomycetota bacterium]